LIAGGAPFAAIEHILRRFAPAKDYTASGNFFTKSLFIIKQRYGIF